MKKDFLPFLLMISLLACCMEIDMSVASFPAMRIHFKVSQTIIQMTIAYNFLGFCIACGFYGPLSECYGRKKVMVIGNALMIVGALGCFMSNNSINFLLFARFIQGLGAATSIVVAFAIIADIYQGKHAVRAIGLMNSSLTVFMAAAPILGAFVNETIGWRGNYAIILIITLLSWLLLVFFLPETKKKLDVFDMKKILMDYKKLFSDPYFTIASLIPSLLCAGYMAFVACSSFLYVENMGLSIIQYAMHQGCIVGSFSIVSLFADKIIVKYDKKKLLLFCSAVSVLGALIFVLSSILLPLYPFVVTVIMIIIAAVIAIIYLVVFAQSLEIHPKIKGTASSAIMGVRALLMSGLVTISGYLFNGSPLSIALIILITYIIAAILTLKFLRYMTAH